MTGRNAGGMTLVELMISIVIGLIIMGMVAYSFHNANLVVRRSMALLDIGEQELLLNRLMSADVENIDKSAAMSLRRTPFMDPAYPFLFSGLPVNRVNGVRQTLRFRVEFTDADLSYGLDVDGTGDADNYGTPPAGRWVGYEFDLITEVNGKDARVRRRDPANPDRTQYSWPVVVRRGHMVAAGPIAGVTPSGLPINSIPNIADPGFSDVPVLPVTSRIVDWPSFSGDIDTQSDWPNFALGMFWTKWQPDFMLDPTSMVGLHCSDSAEPGHLFGPPFCTGPAFFDPDPDNNWNVDLAPHYCAHRDIDAGACEPLRLLLNMVIVGRMAQIERRDALDGPRSPPGPTGGRTTTWVSVAGTQECDLEALLFGR